MTFDRFVHVLTKQLWVWRAATGLLRFDELPESQRRGAVKRLANAQRAIDDAVLTRAQEIAREQCIVPWPPARNDGNEIGG